MMLRKRLASLALLLVLCSLSSCSRSPIQLEMIQLIPGRTMGTTYSVKFVSSAKGPTIEVVAQAVESELERVNQQMSTYIPDSEISRFNASESTEWFAVSAETAAVVSVALEVNRLTEGAFDATVGPLVDLWGFGPSGRPDSPPSDQAVDAVLGNVGSDKLEVRLEPPALRKTVSGVHIDLSAIAKGHGVDRVAETISKLGVENFFVEVGGEVRTKGRKPGGLEWQVGIERPVMGQRSVELALPLNDLSLATSGDYRNVISQGGDTYSHFIDVKTGRPMRGNVASASVFDPSCCLADAIATGLMASKSDTSMKLAERNGWAVLLMTREGESIRVQASPKFLELFPDADLNKQPGDQ